MKCAACGTQNRKGMAFCTDCGEPLKKEVAQKRRQTSGGNSKKKIAAIIMGLAVVALVVMSGSQDGLSSQAGPSIASSAYGLEVQEVASKFWCSCGSCEEPELTQCTCPTAAEEKKFIDRELKKGVSKAEVIQAVQSRYGHIKSQYASFMQEQRADTIDDTDPVEVRAAVAEETVVSALESEAIDRIATDADTLAIAERFTCACGQCGELVLAECTCEHPRGAHEMKAFIAYKISQQSNTVDEIVKVVNYEYGHLRKE